MDIYRRNIMLFQENRELSKTKYSKETEELVENTKFYEDASLSVKDIIEDSCSQVISFINDDTSHAGWELKKDNPNDRVAILNFADALIPGGLVDIGELTQEESICRSSNLYESLLKGKEFYYDYNRSLGHYLYSHRLIYSPNVLIFRNEDTGEFYDKPEFVDVITSPAPSEKSPYKLEFEKMLCRRIECIIKSAYDNDVNIIVLGAWGCGAFGQSPEQMGRCFAKVLKRFNIFKEVVFAFKSIHGDKNRSAFEEAFNLEYLV